MLVSSKTMPSGPLSTVTVPRLAPSLARSLVTLVDAATQMLAPSKAISGRNDIDNFTHKFSSCLRSTGQGRLVAVRGAGRVTFHPARASNLRWGVAAIRSRRHTHFGHTPIKRKACLDRTGGIE